MKEANDYEEEEKKCVLLCEKGVVLRSAIVTFDGVHHSFVLDGPFLLHEKHGYLQHATIHFLAEGNAVEQL